MRRIGQFLCFAILFVLALVITGCAGHPDSAATPDPAVQGDAIRFPSQAPQLASFTVQSARTEGATTEHLFGRLAWDEDVTVRVFTPFEGHVGKVEVDMGESVPAGAVLAEVESADFGEAQADARTAGADERLAEANLARERDLYEHGAAALKDVEAAEAEAARATSQHARAQARLTAYGARADKVDGVFQLRSPIAGAVVERNVTPGQEIRPDQMLAGTPELSSPLFVVSDPRRLWIEIDATEDQLASLSPGMPFDVESSAFPGKLFHGHVACVSKSVDPVTHTVTARGVVDNASQLLKAGMFVAVNATSPAPSRSDVVLPSGAVILEGNRHFVFVERAPGTFARREIQIGAQHDAEDVISVGVRPGERVVTDGAILLERYLD